MYYDPDDETEVEANGACAYCGQPLLDPVPDYALAE